MQISRRSAMLGATAAAAVTGLTVAPLAMKAAGVKAALAGEPLVAMEQEWLAQRDYVHNYPDESDEALAPLYLVLDEIEERIYTTPAQTLQGVAIKLRLWDYFCGPFEGRPYEEMWWRADLNRMTYDKFGFANVMRDLERLAGDARS